MILFREDYKRFPNAIIDTQTNNKSFLELAYKFREAGIVNNAFHLVLLDASLQGVDPFSPDLTLEQKVAIGVECRLNFWYYLREIVRLPPQAGVVPVRYIANRANIAQAWSFFCHIDFFLVMPRQTGKSVGADCIHNWLVHFGASNTNINLLTKDSKLRTENVDRLKQIRDLFPSYLLDFSKDVDNQFTVEYKKLKNKIITSVAQKSEAGATNLGRGLTSPISHIDESPFIHNIDISLPVMLASGGAARDEARKTGSPYGTMYTTTAGKKDTREGKFIYDLMDGAAVWDENYYDTFNQKELYKRIDSLNRGNQVMINGTFSHLQVGKSNEWLINALKDSGSKGQNADRDYFNKWTSGTLSHPLSPELLNVIDQSEMSPVWTDRTRENYETRWYWSKEKIQQELHKTHLIISIDTSNAVGKDGISVVYLDIRDLSTVAVSTVSETNLLLHAAHVCRELVKIPNSTLIIEKASSYMTYIDYLLLNLPKEGYDPFKRIYNTLWQDMGGHSQLVEEAKMSLRIRSSFFYDKFKSFFGFSTTAQSRQELYGRVMQNTAKLAGHMTRDKVLTKEIKGLVEKNGRIDHAASGHDDTVISWLLGSWFCHNAKNLSEYEIKPGLNMSRVYLVKDEEAMRESVARKEQERLREAIEGLAHTLKNSNNAFLNVKLEKQLSQLMGEASYDGGEVITRDQLTAKHGGELDVARMKKRKLLQQRKMNRAYGEAA